MTAASSVGYHVSSMELEEELKPFRGGLVEGLGGYKIARPLPPGLSRKARKADLVRRIREIWYIRGPQGWKAEGDRISFLERLVGRFRGRRPQTDAESRAYWEARGGEGYDAEAFSEEWVSAARKTFSPIVPKLREEGIRSLVEVGCGTARNLTILHEHGGFDLRGLDFSFSQLQKSRGRGFAVGQATAKILPLRDKCVDAVMFAQVLIHVPPPIRPVIREAVRVARRCVVLLENPFGAAGLESQATDNPHCFRHDLTAHMREEAPDATLIELPGDEFPVRIFRL